MLHKRRGFTLIELLVVLGIIVILISILLPSIASARRQAESAVCASNLKQIGAAMLSYAYDHDGWLFPSDMGWDSQHVYTDPATGELVHNVWTVKVFGVWNPPIMLCPSDLDPAGQHSYVLNDHLAYRKMMYSTKPPGGKSPSEIIVMGEKVTLVQDYYMEYDEYDKVVEKYRHGLYVGSNYLMLDLHVESELPQEAKQALDPWDFAAGVPPPTTAPS